MKGFEHLATSGTHRPREVVRREYAEAIADMGAQAIAKLTGSKLSPAAKLHAINRALADPNFGLLDAAGVPTNLPMETPSQAKGHWRKKAKTAAAQRARMRREVARWLEAHGPVMRITVTRVAPRRLDEPNLGAALKHAIDGLSDALRIDDGSRAVEWVLKQRKGQATVEWEVKAL